MGLGLLPGFPEARARTLKFSPRLLKWIIKTPMLTPRSRLFLRLAIPLAYQIIVDPTSGPCFLTTRPCRQVLFRIPNIQRGASGFHFLQAACVCQFRRVQPWRKPSSSFLGREVGAVPRFLIKSHPTVIYFLTMLVGAGGNAGGQSTAPWHSFMFLVLRLRRSVTLDGGLV